LEASQKKLISKVDRVTKSKQNLENIKVESDKFHDKSLPSLSSHIRQHTTDLNPWANILESDREYKYKNVVVPGNEIHSKEFLQQMQELRDLVYKQNVHFENLLNDRSKEKQEVISVAMGKLKKRDKTKQELEMEAESGQVLDDSEEEVQPGKEKSTKSKSKKPSEKSSSSASTASPAKIPELDLKKQKESDGDKKADKPRGFVKATSPRGK